MIEITHNGQDWPPKKNSVSEKLKIVFQWNRSSQFISLSETSNPPPPPLIKVHTPLCSPCMNRPPPLDPQKESPNGGPPPLKGNLKGKGQKILHQCPNRSPPLRAQTKWGTYGSGWTFVGDWFEHSIQKIYKKITSWKNAFQISDDLI